MVIKEHFFVVRNATKMTFVEESVNIIGNLPPMLARKLEAKHLISNIAAGYVYVVAFSEGALTSKDLTESREKPIY